MPLILEKTLAETFLKRATSTPDRIGFTYKVEGRWNEVSYGAFLTEVRSLSFGLMGLGISRGDRVAILSGTRYEWSVCDMAILGASAVTVPIYPSSNAADILFILSHSGASLLILENQAQLKKILTLRSENPEALSTLRKIVMIEGSADGYEGADVVSLDEVRRLSPVEEARDPSRFETHLRSARPEDLLSIVYTSGTTGIPKGALITHDNLVSVLEDCVAILSDFIEPEGETTLSFLPFSHILGKVESMAGYVFGWKQGFAESTEKFLANLTEVRPTLLFSVPRTFEKAWTRIQGEVSEASFVKKRLFHWAVAAGESYYKSIRRRELPAPRDFAQYFLARKLIFRNITQAFGGRLRYVICGGAPLSQELGEFFEIAGIKILEGYGLTETCGPISVNTPEDVRFGTVGRPLPEVSVRIGEEGEIAIRSRKVFAGYYRAPELTQEVMPDGWLKTGDIGFIDDDGFIHITDRKKDMIVTAGGKNIAPQRIENLAKGYSWINQIVVLGDRRPYLVALLALNREEVIQAASEKGILFSEYAELIRNPKIISMTHSIIEKINSELGRYESIRKFMILPNEFTIASGELTPSLKVKRRVVEARYRDEIESLYESR